MTANLPPALRAGKLPYGRCPSDGYQTDNPNLTNYMGSMGPQCLWGEGCSGNGLNVPPGIVSSGIISATRVIEGLRYIQSDVAITHGSSGGALSPPGVLLGQAFSSWSKKLR